MPSAYRLLKPSMQTSNDPHLQALFALNAFHLCGLICKISLCLYFGISTVCDTFASLGLRQHDFLLSRVVP